MDNYETINKQFGKIAWDQVVDRAINVLKEHCAHQDTCEHCTLYNPDYKYPEEMCKLKCNPEEWKNVQ